MAGKNRGTEFERALELVFDQYERQGLARIRKVDPPVKVIGVRKIFLPNPWLDFVGAWNEQGGRMIAIEAKHTQEPRLGLDTSDGLKIDQWRNAMGWEAFGALVVIAWRYGEEVRFTTPAQIRALTARQERKSLRWCDAHRAEKGFGFIQWDVLGFARKLTAPGM